MSEEREVPKFELGDEVTFKAHHVLYRGKDEKYRDVWMELVDRGSKTWFEQSLPKTLTGIIVGKRTGKNGYTSSGSWDEPVGFEFGGQVETVTYYLVAYDLHRKIEKVFPNRLKKVEL